MTDKKIVYLAAPYSHKDFSVKVDRFERINKVAARLMLAGEVIFSPISQTHPIALAGGLPGDWQFWEKYDRAMLESCKELVVLMLDGWKESTGVTAEIKIAGELGIPVKYIEETVGEENG